MLFQQCHAGKVGHSDCTFEKAAQQQTLHTILSLLHNPLPLVSNLLKASVIMTSAADNVTILIQKIFRLNVAATELTLETLRMIQLLTGIGNAVIIEDHY